MFVHQLQQQQKERFFVLTVSEEHENVTPAYEWCKCTPQNTIQPLVQNIRYLAICKLAILGGIIRNFQFIRISSEEFILIETELQCW
jgi:hypothetical protein